MTFFGLNADQLRDRGGDWTAREIRQQPAVWAETDEAMRKISAEARAFLGEPGLRVILSGAGSSDYIGRSLAADLGAEAIATTDLVVAAKDYLRAGAPTLMVSFARSGNSPESVAATEIVDHHLPGCRHLVITCNEQGGLYRRHAGRSGSLVALLPEATHDRGFAMTSSFTSMLLAARRLLTPDQPIDTVRIGAAASSAIADEAGSLSSTVGAGFERVAYLGSRGLQGIADEAALKLLELTDGEIVAIAQSPLGFRHGPKTFVNPATLVVQFLSNDPVVRRYDLDLARELTADRIAGRVLVLSGRADGLEGLDALVLPGLETAGDAELALVFVVWAQMHALGRSLALGRTPDSPSRSGSVNRVVKGVTIYPQETR